MSGHDYSINALVDTFYNHAKQANENYKKQKSEWEEVYKGKYPHSDWSIASALLTITKEIKALKEKAS